jgi:hypothetical protein
MKLCGIDSVLEFKNSGRWSLFCTGRMQYKIAVFKHEIASFLAMVVCDVVPSSSTQKMQAADSFETKVTVHQCTFGRSKVACSFKRDFHTNPKFNTGAVSVTSDLEAFN